MLMKNVAWLRCGCQYAIRNKDRFGHLLIFLDFGERHLRVKGHPSNIWRESVSIAYWKRQKGDWIA